VLAVLSILLNQAISQEQLSAERKKMQAQQQELNDQQAQRELLEKAKDRLNNLKMIPADMLGKPSHEIKNKYYAVKGLEIKESEFGALTIDALHQQKKVLDYLDEMANQREMIEINQRKAAQESPAEDLEQPSVELKPEIDNNIAYKKEIPVQTDYSEVYTFLKGAELSPLKVQLLHAAFVDDEGRSRTVALAKLRIMFSGS
jgi:hypothetical protein